MLTSLIQTAYAVIPTAIGIAVLRHRLYDITSAISTGTPSYAALPRPSPRVPQTTVLALQLVLAPLTSDSGCGRRVHARGRRPVPPAKTRIQAVVDRRFFRHKYDAARTLDAFSARLRNQLDLDSLSDDLEWSSPKRCSRHTSRCGLSATATRVTFPTRRQPGTPDSADQGVSRTPALEEAFHPLRLTISTKLIAAFAGLLALIAILGFSSVSRTSAMRADTENIGENVVPGTRTIGELKDLTGKYRRNQILFTLRQSDKDELDGNLADITTALSDYRSKYVSGAADRRRSRRSRPRGPSTRTSRRACSRSRPTTSTA